MNILPHKSWHVRNKNNIERVKRDEAKAAEEEKEKLRRIALAEQEARTELLRKRARGNAIEENKNEPETKAVQGTSAYGEDQLATDIYSGGHINLFHDAESGEKNAKFNKEHEAEKKAEQEAWEKKVGILTYLGQGSNEEDVSKPWYTRKREREDKDDEAEKYDKKYIKDKKLKDSMDPLKKMKEYVSKKEHKHKHKSKHKHKHKSKREEKDAAQEKVNPKPAKSIEQLRAERLQREMKERKKTQDLMAKLRGEKPAEESMPEQEDNDRNRKYNSQYNPEFARSWKKQRT